MEEKRLCPEFQHREYLFRRKVFTLFGAAFHIYDEQGKLVFYSRQKPFRIREDFRIYSDETMAQEVLTIKTPHVFDIWASYEVEDPVTMEKVGSIKRKALKSIVKDEWTFFSPEGKETGKLTEASLGRALLSRFANLIPQVYEISDSMQKVAAVRQHFNPFILRYTMSINASRPEIDPRLLIAAGILLAGVERRQQ